MQLPSFSRRGGAGGDGVVWFAPYIGMGAQGRFSAGTLPAPCRLPEGGHEVDGMVGVPNGRIEATAQTPSFSASSSIVFAATSTGVVGAGSPLPGPNSLTFATCAVRKPCAAAAFRSPLCAATIITWLGSILNASTAARYTTGLGL